MVGLGSPRNILSSYEHNIIYFTIECIFHFVVINYTTEYGNEAAHVDICFNLHILNRPRLCNALKCNKLYLIQKKKERRFLPRIFTVTGS